MGMRWTDAMHATFLDKMEASFVETVLMGTGGGWWCGEDEEEQLPFVLGAGRPDGPLSPSPSSGSSEVVSGPTSTERRLPDDGAESTLNCQRGSQRPKTTRRVLRETLGHRARRGTKRRKTSSQRCNDLSKDLDQVVPVFEGQGSVAAAKVEKIKTLMSSSSLSFDVDFNKPK